MVTWSLQDISVKFGQRILDASLWRDEVLAELHERDEAELTHLHATIQPNGKGKCYSFNHMTVKVHNIMLN